MPANIATDWTPTITKSSGPTFEDLISNADHPSAADEHPEKTKGEQ